VGLNARLGIAGLGLLPDGDRANSGVRGVFSAIGPGIPVSIMGPANALLYASLSTSLTTTAAGATAELGSATGLAVGASINSPLVPPGTIISVLAGTTATLGLPTLTLPGTLLPNGQIVGLPSVDWLTGATVTGPGLPTAGLVVNATVAPSPQAGFPIYAPPGARVLNGGGSVQLALGAVSPVASPNGDPQFFQFRLAAAGIAAGVDAAAVFTGAGVTFNATVQLERSFDGGRTWVVCNVGGSGQLAQYLGATTTPISLTFAEPEQGVAYRWNCIAWTSGTINYRISTTGGAAMVLPLNQLA
jgi:hypothetical protein